MLAGIENRRRLTGAMVIGNEVSRVAILMEDMDWVINPARQRLTVNALNIVFQVWVLETAKNFLDISRVLLRVKGVAFDQHRAVFLHRALHDGSNFLVEDCIANRLVAC